jgi:hypothetical protein
MELCDLCEKQKALGRRADPHEHLEPLGAERVFRGGMTGGYEDQDYKCTRCGASFLHSNDKNDFGWMLCGPNEG